MFRINSSLASSDRGDIDFFGNVWKHCLVSAYMWMSADEPGRGIGPGWVEKVKPLLL
jgi:hypothetical protein